MKKNIILTIIILIVIALTALIFDLGRKESPTQDFSDTIVPEEITNKSSTSSSDMPIFINNIKDGQQVSSPIKIEGKARGNWFFEGSFPIKLIDIDGNTIGTAIAKADGEWMTTNFVNFTADLEYVKSTSTDHALLVLSKDNPSDIRELDQSIYIPVILK